MPRPTIDSPLARILAAGSIRRVEVAARAGCSLATLDRIGHGRVDGIKLGTLARVSAALGVAPAELVPSLATRPRGGLLAERGRG